MKRPPVVSDSRRSNLTGICESPSAPAHGKGGPDQPLLLVGYDPFGNSDRGPDERAEGAETGRVRERGVP